MKLSNRLNKLSSLLQGRKRKEKKHRKNEFFVCLFFPWESKRTLNVFFLQEMRAYRENNIYRFEWNASTTLKFVFFTVFPFIGLYQLSKSRLVSKV